MSDKLTPIKAIKNFCFECSGEQLKEVKKCTDLNCPLYPFRLGKNPYAKRNYTLEQRKAMSERMKKARESYKKEEIKMDEYYKVIEETEDENEENKKMVNL